MIHLFIKIIQANMFVTGKDDYDVEDCILCEKQGKV